MNNCDVTVTLCTSDGSALVKTTLAELLQVYRQQPVTAGEYIRVNANYGLFVFDVEAPALGD